MNDAHAIAILGDGGWGTTLAVLCAEQGRRVRLWSAFPEHAQAIRTQGENKKFLPGIPVSHAIQITADLAEAIAEARIIVIAAPSQYLRQTVERLRTLPLGNRLLVSAAKGIERGTLLRMSEVVQQTLGTVHLAVLSGPTIAREVAEHLPTACVVASMEIRWAEEAQDALSAPHFRLYTQRDVVGVELGGSLKNVVAIAAGIADGLGFGSNTKAALLTRGMAEITRLGVACGAQPDTFWGLSGFGDLLTTCVSPQSRNRSLGEALGRGERLRDLLAKTEMVVEGVETARSARDLAQRHGIDMPITREVYAVLYEDKSPQAAVQSLLMRERRSECSE